MTSQTLKNRLYFKELGAALVGYAIILGGALHLAPGLEPGVLRTAVYLSPMAAMLLAVWAIVRHYRRCDEYVRKSLLEIMSVSAGVTAGWTFTYGFMELAGYPRLSMFTVWPVMGAVWLVLALSRSAAGRRARSQRRRPMRAIHTH